VQVVPRVNELAANLARIQREAGIDISEEEYVKSINWNLVQVVHEWALGTVRTQLGSCALLFVSSCSCLTVVPSVWLVVCGYLQDDNRSRRLHCSLHYTY